MDREKYEVITESLCISECASERSEASDDVMILSVISGRMVGLR